LIKYLLDANVVIALLNRSSDSLYRKVKAQPPEAIAISAVVLHELYYGAFKSRHRDKNVSLVDKLQFTELEFDADDARAAGLIRAELDKRGTPIGPYDVLIAGQALSQKLKLVTNNIREFGRVKGLKVEDWT